MMNLNKGKEIIYFLTDNLDVKINKGNIQEIEKKYKEAQSFLKKEMLFRLPAIIACFIFLFLSKDFPFAYMINIGLIICIILNIVWSLFMLYHLHRCKSKIRKYYQSK